MCEVCYALQRQARKKHLQLLGVNNTLFSKRLNETYGAFSFLMWPNRGGHKYYRFNMISYEIIGFPHIGHIFVTSPPLHKSCRETKEQRCMSISIYVYIYIYICIHIYIYTYIHKYIYTYMLICIYIHIYIYAYIYVYIHIYIYTCIHVYICICIHIHMYEHIYKYHNIYIINI